MYLKLFFLLAFINLSLCLKIGKNNLFSQYHFISSKNKLFSNQLNSIETKLVHSGCEPDNLTGNIVPSITLGTTFIQELPGVKPGIQDPNSYGGGYFYSRQANPTRGSLERAISDIENASYTSVFSSGMAAISTVINLLDNGDHVIAFNDLYGGTVSYFNDIATKTNGIKFDYVDLNNLTHIEQVKNNRTRMFWFESLSNPLLECVDIKKIVKYAKKNNLLVVIDSTFLSPYLFNGLNYGADIIVHSATKYIGGHSDILMGCLVTNNENLNKKIRFLQTGIGSVPSPFECYLALRGLKTLHLRMRESEKNALKIAKYLESHKAVEKVIYPGLKSYKQYDLAKKQFRGSGSMITIYLKGNKFTVEKFLKSLKVFSLAVSLGAVESLICSPALMTHASVPKETREKIGLTDNSLRISIGVENIKDLINDLENSLSNIKN